MVRFHSAFVIGFFRFYCKDDFTTKDTKSTKFGVLILRTIVSFVLFVVNKTNRT